MYVQILVLNNDKRNRMTNFVLASVLVWRRNEELQPEVVRGNGHEKVTVLRPDDSRQMPCQKCQMA